MQVKVKKLNPNAVIPKYSTIGAAGMDVVAVSKNVTKGYIEYGTGLAFELPPGFCMLLLPRSSVSNTTLSLANSVGLLDEDYRGEVKFRFRNNGEDESNIYGISDRIGQILIVPYPKIELEETEELGETERNTGSYGSTGK